MKRSTKTKSDSENSFKTQKFEEDSEVSWKNLKTNTFQEKLCGSENILRPFKSSHTHRILKPYIRQDFDTEPIKLKLLREINQRNSKNPVPKLPINYTYIQSKHVPQINRLACKFFWPGIDGKYLHLTTYLNKVN